MVRIGKYEVSRDFFVFIIICILLGVVSAVESTSLANRLYEDLDFTVMKRSMLETPRELPGLLSVVIIGMMNGLGDIRIAAVANIIGGTGLLFFGMTPNVFSMVLLFLMVYSTGQHLYLPLSNTIGMSFAGEGNFGEKLGQVQSVTSMSVIGTSALLYILYKCFDASYAVVFTIAGAAMIAAGVLFFIIGRDSRKIVGTRRFIFRREFKMYYILSVINGARKQITITFVPWLLIDIFGRSVTYITAMFFIVCILNVFFKPWYGRLIDRRGESYALQFEAVIMFAACIGFAFAKVTLPFGMALAAVSVCYVGDKLMEQTSGMARATLAKKISREESEVARTLTMGQSMDHAVSMCIPVCAGALWYAGGANGYIYVFIGALIISMVNFAVAGKIKDKKEFRLKKY